VNMAKSVMNQLIKHGSIQRGLLGVQVQDLTHELATAFGVSITHGAVVAQVIPDSAASHAGVKSGDIIIAVNDSIIDNSAELRNYIGLKRPGDMTKLKILRGKKTIEIKAIIGGGDGETTASHMPKLPSQSAFNGQQLHPSLYGAQFAKSNQQQAGVEVLKVIKDSPAWQTGLRDGDLIIAINRLPIQSLQDLKKLATKNTSRAIALNIHRGNSALYIVLK